MGTEGTAGRPGAADFPIVTFAGTDAPTNWGGTTENMTHRSKLHGAR